ncbi:MAG TPA: hypothetical protein VJL57_00775 [Candidatus Paceibacterota bacterium]
MKWVTSLFKKKVPRDRFSDFFLNETFDNQKKVIEEAARKANEEQRKVFFKFRH